MNKKIFIGVLFVLFLALISLFWSKPEGPKNVIILSRNAQWEVTESVLSNHIDRTTFPAVVRSSGEKPVETTYTGVELIKLFSALGIALEGYQKVIIKASDGYEIIFSMDEMYEPQNIYLADMRDGEKMQSKSYGGNGPYQLIIRRDPFSQRWIKHVNQIILE